MYIYGLHPVREAIESAPDRVRALYCERPQEERFEFAARFARSEGLEMVRKAATSLDDFAGGGNHQGIVAEVDPFEYTPLDEIIEKTSDRSRASLVVLDQIQDPRNLGAVLRSGAAFGVDGAVIPKDRAAPVTPVAIRSSAGQAYRTPIARVTNLSRTLETLHEEGWWSVGFFKSSAKVLSEIDLDMKTILVFGNEGRGIRRLVGETCDWRATIPMAEGVESLNIASAATAGLYEVSRQWGHDVP